MPAPNRVIVIHYTDGKRDVLRLDPEAFPQVFASDGILNIRGSFQSVGQFIWHYFPLINIKHYQIEAGESA